ncbi:MAG: hypothetical protein KIT74_00160 [Fimbriimonadales bacterium]|nr:hypothetical protein [Fimbriimonadales bacterium]
MLRILLAALVISVLGCSSGGDSQKSPDRVQIRIETNPSPAKEGLVQVDVFATKGGTHYQRATPEVIVSDTTRPGIFREIPMTPKSDRWTGLLGFTKGTHRLEIRYFDGDADLTETILLEVQ